VNPPAKVTEKIPPPELKEGEEKIEEPVKT